MKITVVEAKKPKDHVLIDLDVDEAALLLEDLIDMGTLDSCGSSSVIHKVTRCLREEIGE